ncbi:Spb1 C-terminal domain-containing protein [Lipomyces oligophaga]|uniref:Spb1 C-terminal domain-containing protein n=1 Tax=Lipomyces oligophaga TaxID=45792 RepID=UPI0034CF919F
MGKSQKKFGKGRLDHYYRLAKEKGYRARAAFKILQINQKFGHFLEKSKVVIDLCAAPGSWCQVASTLCPSNSLIVGVDLAPIKPIPNVISFVEDITSSKCRAQLRQHLKTWKADAVLHDGAPNVGTAWVQDAFTQSELVLQSLKLATEFLVPGGIFVTKVFRSKDYNNLMWVFNQLFDKVEATKPPASRNVSAEIFVVCRGFKAPKRIDPKFLDPRSVFEDLAAPAPNYQATVYNPEKKKRKREGYEEGDYLQFKTMSVLDFARHDDPIACLGSMSQFTFDIPEQNEGNNDLKSNNEMVQNESDENQLKKIKKLEETTRELKEAVKDLKVLGKKDFRAILKWRLKCRRALGLDQEKENTPEPEDPTVGMTEEEKIDYELGQFQDRESAKQKRERRRERELRAKELTRMQLGMLNPVDIGIDAATADADDLFNLKQVEKSGTLIELSKGKMNMIPVREERKSKVEEIEIGIDLLSEADRLEDELDNMYEAYKGRRADTEAKKDQKRLRNEAADSEWYGFEEKEEQDEEDDEEEDDEEEDDDGIKLDEDYDSEEEFKGEIKAEDIKAEKILTSLEDESAKIDGLSKRAHRFFQQDLVRKIAGLESDSDDDEAIEQIIAMRKEGVKKEETSDLSGNDHDLDMRQKKNTFEVVKTKAKEWSNGEEQAASSDSDEEAEQANVDIITAEAMTLAHEIALKQKNKTDLIDDSYNRYWMLEREGLPDWFLDEERRFNRPNRPITAEAAAAIQAKLRALNARPIKKVLEAQARKKMKAGRKLERLRKKSDIIIEDPNKTEKEKAESIQKLMRKATKKTERSKVSVVVARGANRGLSGRPKGVKGRYKMVDPRMKKELRAIKRRK